ncbi:MAG: ABC transporter permease [Firmicutes bacterium]|nr:ABC transporter permease [Bacillota bacterium]
MTHYIVRRLLLLPVVAFGATLLIFIFMQFLSPYQLVSTYVRSPEELRHADLDTLVKKYHLDAPFYERYFDWVGNILHGNLGWSATSNDWVAHSIAARFPATLELAIYAAIPMALGGIWLGTVAAVNHNRFWDHVTRIFAIIGWSLPTFVFGLVFLMVFYVWLGWFPPGRLSTWATQVVISPSFHAYTGMYSIDALLNGRLDVFFNALQHLVGPVITLSYLYWALLLRITRSSMLESLRQDYVRTARAKGLEESVVIKKHARRNALIPVATSVGLMFLGLLAGVIITETVFNYPGIGLLTYQAAAQLDYPMVLGICLLYAGLLVLVNLVVDIGYALIDPRVSLD